MNDLLIIFYLFNISIQTILPLIETLRVSLTLINIKEMYKPNTYDQSANPRSRSRMKQCCHAAAL